jgi:uncharacterized lipoprotein YmbA
MLNRRRFMCLFGATLTALMLTSCGNVPQPFRRAPTSSNPLLANPSGAGIGIVAPVGIDHDAADYIAEWIAEDLRRREIPAEAVRRTGILSFTLEGNLREATEDALSTTLIFDWRLLNRLGQIVERLDQTIVVDTLAWNSAEESTRDLIARNMSEQMAQLLAPPLAITPIQKPTSPWAGLSVTIQKLEGAPGDGAQALGRAMANRLAKEGLTPAGRTADIIVAATVSVTRYDASQDDVAIIWQILGPNGQSLGDVRLDNRIPHGELDGPWGFIADAIVDSALPGLLEIIAAR